LHNFPDAELRRGNGGLRPARHIQSPQDSSDVRLDSALSEAELAQ
jgi:hypothetical protein